ncbi:MAG: hypothetical protein ACKO34_07330 [Vampirovibrionales bacterium]
MTREELETLLEGQVLSEVLDVRTLTLDLLKKAELEDLIPLFYDHLRSVTQEQLEGYFFMKRG